MIRSVAADSSVSAAATVPSWGRSSRARNRPNPIPRLPAMTPSCRSLCHDGLSPRSPCSTLWPKRRRPSAVWAIAWAARLPWWGVARVTARPGRPIRIAVKEVPQDKTAEAVRDVVNDGRLDTGHEVAEQPRSHGRAHAHARVRELTSGEPRSRELAAQERHLPTAHEEPVDQDHDLFGLAKRGSSASGPVAQSKKISGAGSEMVEYPWRGQKGTGLMDAALRGHERFFDRLTRRWPRKSPCCATPRNPAGVRWDAARAVRSRDPPTPRWRRSAGSPPPS